MSSVECPRCHMLAANALAQSYCPHCGWNRAEVEQRTRVFLRLLPVLVILFDAPLIIYVFVGRAEVALLAALGAVAVIPAILVRLVVRAKMRIPSPKG